MIEKYIATYAATLVAFGALDALWLGVIMKKTYAQAFGSLMRENPVWWAAILFYALYIVGILVFAIVPHAAGPWWKVLAYGAALGFLAYMTYDLTSLAITKGFPGSIVALDIVWGAVVTGVSAVVGYFIYNLFA